MGVITGTVTALKNLIPEKLLDDDPVMEDQWNKIVDAISNCVNALETVDKKITPVGMIYVQLPNKSLPTTMWPGTSWSDVSETFAGGFFRAKGGYADGTGAKQEDAIRNIIGYMPKNNGGAGLFPSTGFNGAFYSSIFTGDAPSSAAGYSNSGALHFDASRSVPTAPENRPENYAVTIWQCTAV